MSTTSLTLHDSDGKLVATVCGAFNLDDIRLLQKFSAAMTRIRSAALLKRGLPTITNFKWSGAGMEFSCEPYTDAELFELLHVLRHVILSREAASFANITALLGKRFSSKEFAHNLKHLRDLFENGEMRSYMQISIGGQPLFDDSLLRMWLNGTQYHTEEEKSVAWASLEGSLKSENARAIVMNQLHSRVNALLLLEDTVNLILSNQASA